MTEANPRAANANRFDHITTVLLATTPQATQGSYLEHPRAVGRKFPPVYGQSRPVDP